MMWIRGSIFRSLQQLALGGRLAVSTLEQREYC